MTRILTCVIGCALAAPALGKPPARSQLLSADVDQPTSIASTPADPQHIYVCERPGRVQVLDKDTGAKAPVPFLSIISVVSVMQENGLLGMAFDPDYQTNGYFYVYYVDNGNDAKLVRYHVPTGAASADPTSAYTILRFHRPLGHVAGWVAFGPNDGLLYLSSGDGDLGGTYDAANHAQTITEGERLGKILRIDPRSDDYPDDPDRNFHIPASNPFAGVVGANPEIWAYGLRNPWRCSFDRMTGDLWIGDVGKDNWEEIDLEPAGSAGGRDYGWPCLEGAHCTDSPFCVCSDETLVPPVYEFPHPIGNCVIGGCVYRGSAIPEFQGRYIFAEFVRNMVWSFVPDESNGFSSFLDLTTDLIPPGDYFPISSISAFGEDSAGELYMASVFTGSVYKIVPYPCAPVIDAQPGPVSRPQSTSFTLSVRAAGYEPLTFQWRRGDVDLVDDARIQGSDGPSLTIGEIQPSDSGEYTVIVTSPCGSVSSAPTEVTVYACIHADMNGDGAVTVQDIFAFLSYWFSTDPRADFNHADGVTVQDVFDYLAAWFLSCP